jgi:putative NADH-flavin reductase
MKIVVLGASGHIGSEITRELAGRGHAVTAVARKPDAIPTADRVTPVAGDASDPAALAERLRGADAVISALHFDVPAETLLSAVRTALRGVSDVDWTFFSPAALIEAGPRLGRYRTGGDQLVTDDKGESRISFADYALAMVDELEQPKHSRARFTAAY